MDCRPYLIFIGLMSLLLTSCATHREPSPSAVGAGIGAVAGASGAALLGVSKPVPLIAAGIGGAALGYYLASKTGYTNPLTQAGGQVFTLGEYLAINIPSDRLFDSNSADFLPEAGPILDTTAGILSHYSQHHIIVSGNMSGFSSAKFERKLSELRAKRVTEVLWEDGIDDTSSLSLRNGIPERPRQHRYSRKLIYVGFGNYFPIANDIHNDSIRQNSRIQITAWPTHAMLHPELCQRNYKIFNNIGKLDEAPLKCRSPRDTTCTGYKDVESSFSNASHTNKGGKVSKHAGFKDEKPR